MKKIYFLFFIMFINQSMMFGQLVTPIMMLDSTETIAGGFGKACLQVKNQLEFDLTNSCKTKKGTIIALDYSGCECLEIANSNKKFNCQMLGLGKCLIDPLSQYKVIHSSGKKNTIEGNKFAACFYAEQLALASAKNSCLSVYGKVENVSYDTCDCKQIAGSSSEFLCKVDAIIQCKVVQ